MFIQALGSDVLKQASVKGKGGAPQVNLEDEEAVVRMFKKIEEQNQGDLRTRLKRVGFQDMLN